MSRLVTYGRTDGHVNIEVEFCAQNSQKCQIDPVFLYLISGRNPILQQPILFAFHSFSDFFTFSLVLLLVRVQLNTMYSKVDWIQAPVKCGFGSQRYCSRLRRKHRQRYLYLTLPRGESVREYKCIFPECSESFDRKCKTYHTNKTVPGGSFQNGGNR